MFLFVGFQYVNMPQPPDEAPLNFARVLGFLPCQMLTSLFGTLVSLDARRDALSPLAAFISPLFFRNPPNISVAASDRKRNDRQIWIEAHTFVQHASFGLLIHHVNAQRSFPTCRPQFSFFIKFRFFFKLRQMSTHYLADPKTRGTARHQKK